METRWYLHSSPRLIIRWPILSYIFFNVGCGIFGIEIIKSISVDPFILVPLANDPLIITLINCFLFIRYATAVHSHNSRDQRTAVPLKHKFSGKVGVYLFKICPKYILFLKDISYVNRLLPSAGFGLYKSLCSQSIITFHPLNSPTARDIMGNLSQLFCDRKGFLRQCQVGGLDHRSR